MGVDSDLIAVDEFLQLPDPPEGHYELHHGLVVLTPPRKRLHVRIQQVLWELLLPMTRGKGFLTGEFPFRPAPEHEVWQADIAFVSKQRWEQDESDYFSGAPDLVIEILSPSNTMDEILERQSICFSNGCVAFWTVDPKRSLVLVTTPDKQTVTYEGASSVPLPRPLSGAVEVAAIFMRK